MLTTEQQMKKALLSLLLLAATPAWSQQQPNLIDQMRLCTHQSVVFTQLAIAAEQTDDKDKMQYGAFVEHLIQEQHSQYAAEMLAKLGVLAWNTRGGNVGQTAMDVYDACVDSTGQKT